MSVTYSLLSFTRLVGPDLVNVPLRGNSHVSLVDIDDGVSSTKDTNDTVLEYKFSNYFLIQEVDMILGAWWLSNIWSHQTYANFDLCRSCVLTKYYIWCSSRHIKITGIINEKVLNKVNFVRKSWRKNQKPNLSYSEDSRWSPF